MPHPRKYGASARPRGRHTLRPRQTPPPRPSSAAERIVIVSASVGAGHDGAAAELERRLVAAGLAARPPARPAGRAARPGLGRLVRDGYHRMLLVRDPRLYQRIYSSTERAGGRAAPSHAPPAALRREGGCCAPCPPTRAPSSRLHPGREPGPGSLRPRRPGPPCPSSPTSPTSPCPPAVGGRRRRRPHLALHAVPAKPRPGPQARTTSACGPRSPTRASTP
ncbi:hypothetical protein ACRAWF_21155 [Streptomyces sp. L7]